MTMQISQTRIRRMLVNEAGQNLLEYAVVTAFVALATLAALYELGFSIATSLYNLLIQGLSAFFHLS